MAQMNLPTKQKQFIDIKNTPVTAKGGQGSGKQDRWTGNEVGKFKLLYLEWINNKILMHSTGNYTEYPVVNHNGK